MFENIKGADQAGLQLAIHAIGERANNTILNLYDQVVQQDATRDRTLRIEHAQHLRASDIPRFGSLRVIASVQQYHCIDDGRNRLADLVVLSEDILEMNPVEIQNVKVDLTAFDGKIVYERAKP